MYQNIAQQNRLRLFATIFIVLFGIYYIPLDTPSGFGPIKLSLMFGAVIVLLLWSFKVSKAMVIGTIYLLYQYCSASMHPDTFRWSTLLFSSGLVYSYVCLYNLIYIEKVFTIDYFLKIIKGMMLVYFIVCIIQQLFLIIGISYFPLINLWKILERGIGCNSLSMEPSTFARSMLVFYYAYVKCNEYKRGEGSFRLKELFSEEHKWVTIRFLWMMCTMGSGTAFVCLIAFALYFVRRHNFYYIIPILIAIYSLLPLLHFEQLDRALAISHALPTLDQEIVEDADGSGASRISPILNSFHADFSKGETWFGYGIDYAVNHNLILDQKATLFDDYGFIFYIITLCFNFSCAYRFFSLATVFMFMGVGGTSGGNIHYLWELMIIMTCVRYFYENRFNLIEYENVEIPEKNTMRV